MIGDVFRRSFGKPVNLGFVRFSCPFMRLFREIEIILYRTILVHFETGTFAWLGAEEAEVIFLNDFRWSQAVIAWADLLQIKG